MGVTELKQAAQVTMTSSSKGPGTYPYMAPEMFNLDRMLFGKKEYREVSVVKEVVQWISIHLDVCIWRFLVDVECGLVLIPLKL